MTEERIQKLEERIEKRKAKIAKYQKTLRDEKAKLTKDEDTLNHVKYDKVLKTIQDSKISPELALQAIEKAKPNNQPNITNGGEYGNGEKNY